MKSVLMMLLWLLPLAAWAQSKELERASNATNVLREIARSPDKGVPESLLRKAKGIAVIPNLVKAGFVVGGRRGKGLLSVKNAQGVWTNPIYITMTGGSIGWQAGVQSSDVILIFRTQRSIDGIVNGKFTLGADAAVAAGPVGRQANAATDAELKAEIYSYSRARGLFAGIALDGSVLGIDYSANERIYGKNITPRRVLAGQIGAVADEVVGFRDELEERTVPR
jgi:lipid-binding SYLF domain-containing protein